MPKIKIIRKNNWWIRDSVFEVILDKQRIGYIDKGETNEFEVATGQHKLKIKMGRFGSKDLILNMYNKETKTFVVSRNKTMLFIAMTGLFLITFSFTIIKSLFVHDNTIKSLLSMAPLFILFMFIWTLGSYNYLTIVEENKEI